MSMENFMSFLLGCTVSAVFIFLVMQKLQPEIKYEELYRFCLVKNIPLEGCRIPDRPFKVEVK